ncbi:hypothetical protein SAMN05443999_101250 [Roseovarius azorensis]|uniref:Phage major capsid protein E n=1 Tax=Roseovarius azorensis TaxID=1287727 RepID=A0A1H7G7E0_9RHOB|nr:hypothetical protein [Roseovarius azorensis]SEK34246.1 hypothetical protein SAMN05443999_101250 [Roseovarius azorensis]
MSTPTPFVVDPVLTAIAVNYRNPDIAFIADRVMPRVPVMAPEFKWTWYPPEQMFTVPDTEVGRKGLVQQVEFTGEERTSSVRDYGLDDVVPQRDIDAARSMRAAGNSAFDPEARAVEGLTHLIQLDREKRVAAMVQDPDNYDADKKAVLSGTSQFSHASSDPIALITQALDATFIMRPNVAVIDRKGWTALSTNPNILKAINRTSGDKGRASREAVAELFELSEILVGDTYFNSARKGQTAAFERVWASHLALIHRNTQAGPDGVTPSWGWTAQFDGRVSGRFFDPKVGLKGATTLRVGEQVREVIAAPATGYLFQDVA